MLIDTNTFFHLNIFYVDLEVCSSQINLNLFSLTAPICTGALVVGAGECLSWSQAGKGGASRLSAGRQSSLELGAPCKPPWRRLASIPFEPSSELPDDAENKVDWLVGTRDISFFDTGQCD